METKTQPPSFTVSLRGYDREEVDEYLDSLAEALGQVEEAEEHSRKLQAHVTRLNSRIKELEDRIRADTPRSGSALGERIGLLLHEAEEAAADAVQRAEAEAALIVAAAEARGAEASETARGMTERAEDQARRIETAARGQAGEIAAEAEARAAARTRQIEQWAEQVVSHTRAEEARMVLEQQRAKDAAAVELKSLADQRSDAIATLGGLREALGRAIGLVDKGSSSSPASGGHPVSTETTSPAGTPSDAALADASDAGTANGSKGAPVANGTAGETATSSPFDGSFHESVTIIRSADASIDGTANGSADRSTDGQEDRATEGTISIADGHGPGGDATGTSPIGHPAEDMSEADQFEAKLDAWVAGAAEEE
jgi:DivIVA domain-containing protein